MPESLPHANSSCSEVDGIVEWAIERFMVDSLVVYRLGKQWV